ncbi:MAG TPA: alpha/beta hydrolase [Planctomycetaceae bacterium]|nr:alpha/beta hydrolase [Planctomycetaceae bacterium]
MMPFGVLRLCFTGLFGVALFGLGAYLLYEWTNGLTPTTVESVLVDDARLAPADSIPSERLPVVVPGDDRGGAPYLAWGLGLLFLSVGGALPILPFLGRPPLGEPHSFESARTQRISRPDGSELHVEHYGPDSPLTLVFTHGWSLDRTEWYFVRRALNDRYHLVLWDLAGLGKSSAPGNGDHSLEKMAADLEAVVAEATEGSVVLIGHSIGGMIQQTFCRLFPDRLQDRIQGLVFVHTTYINPVETALGSAVLSALQKPVIEPLNHLMIWLSPLVRLSNWQSYSNGSLHLTSRLSSFAGRQTWGQVDYASRMAATASPAVVARGNLAMLRFDERATLPQVHTPALIVSGQHDRLTQPRASHTLARLLPNAAEVALTPAGHLGHWEQHGAFEAAFVAFVESLPARGERLLPAAAPRLVEQRGK